MHTFVLLKWISFHRTLFTCRSMNFENLNIDDYEVKQGTLL